MSQKEKPELSMDTLALQALESSQDAFAIIDRDFRYLFANQAFADQFGMSVEEFDGLSIADVIGLKVFEDSVKGNMLACFDGETVCYEREFSPDEPGRWVNLTLTPLRDKDGGICGAVVKIRDVTKDREETEALRQSGELTDQAARMAGIGHMLWDNENDTCLECSDIIPEIHGLCREEYIRRGSSVNGMLHVADEDREWLAAEYAKATVPGGTYDIRYRIVRDDGEVRWVHEIFAPYEVRNGKVLTQIGTMRDITAEVVEREELERERFFIKQVEDVTNVGLFVWDESAGRNIYCSDNLAAMHGMTREELMSNVVSEQADVELVHPEDRERVAEAYEKCRLHGDPIDVEYRVEHPEKGVRWYNEVAIRRTLGDGGQLVTMGLLHDVTDRRQSEERFHTYELLASQAEKLGKLGYWIWDVQEEQYLFCSAQIPIMHGISMEAYMALISSMEASTTLIHPEESEQVRTAYNECRIQGTSFDTEYRIVCPDGQIRWIHEIGVANEDENGQIITMLGTMQDVTDRKQGEEELRQRDIVYRQIEDSISIGYWTWDEKDYGVTYCSEGLARIYGMTVNEYYEQFSSMEGELATVHPDDRERVRHGLESVDESDGFFDDEYRILRKDGSVRWVQEVSSTLDWSEDGKPLTSTGTLRDITARKLGEEDLRRREILFGQIEDNFDIGFWSWDRDKYAMEYVSDAYCRIFGYSHAEMIEQSESLEGVLSTIHADDQDGVRKTILASEESGEAYDIEYRIVRKDGGIRWVHEVMAPLRLKEDGSLLSSVGVMRDVTERKEHEDELRFARDRAESASASKSEFLAHMSHELRTPLNAVLGFSDAIRSEVYGPIGDDRYREYLDNIQSSGRLLLALINDLLDMSAIEAGELIIEPEQENLAPLVAEMIELALPSANAKNVVIEWNPDLAELELMIDPRRFRQVILNLLINAVKYTPEGGTVSISGTLNDGGCPVISIRDTGIGMTREEQEAALIPFKQIKNAKVRHVEGTGIGLPLTKNLVELHGGTLTIESVKGEGTCVTITLPEERVTH